MFARTVILLVVACSLVWAEPAAKKSKAGDLKKKLPADAVDGDRVAALFIKDSSAKGQLRFLGGVGTGSGTGSMNANINQLITQKQDMLEQLRPVSSTNNNYPIVITMNGGTGGATGGTYTTATTTGTLPTTTTATTGTAGGTGNGALQAAIQGNPVAAILPQVVGQAVAQSVVQRRRPANRRRQPARRQGGNRRKVVANRRPQGGNRQKGQQVYVIRPGRS